MKYLYVFVLNVLFFIMGVLAIFIVPLVYPFAKWDTLPVPDSNGTTPMIRGDLPKWATWFSTPDERLPGGTYEPYVLYLLNRYGRFVCTWYWLGLRNSAQGFAMVFSKPATGYWQQEYGYMERDGVWYRCQKFTVFGITKEFKAGYRIYRRTSGDFRAVPCFTVTK